MKHTILLLFALVLLLCLCACAEKPEPKPTTDSGEINILPDGNKVPISDAQTFMKETKPTEEKEFDAEPLPTLTMPEIPDPEPVEPETEVADS